MTTRNCDLCKWQMQIDHGYSNYTVEGSEAYCILDKNPHYPEDRWYGNAKGGEYAENCYRFCPGGGAKVDVDRDRGALANYCDDLEVKAYILMVGDRLHI